MELGLSETDVIHEVRKQDWKKTPVEKNLEKEGNESKVSGRNE